MSKTSQKEQNEENLVKIRKKQEKGVKRSQNKPL